MEGNPDETYYRYGYRIGVQKKTYTIQYVKDTRSRLEKRELIYFNRGFRDGRKFLYGYLMEIDGTRDGMLEQERYATREGRACPMPLERQRGENL